MEGTIEKRFWDKVAHHIDTGCWFWLGSLFSNGYGYIHLSGTGKNRKTGLAHKISYLLHKGKIPENYVVMHSCDNPACVNPEHLSVGTRSDNMQDCIKKGRFRGGPPLGNKNAKRKEKA